MKGRKNEKTPLSTDNRVFYTNAYSFTYNTPESEKGNNLR